IMQLDSSGKVQSYRFEKTVIHSAVKGVYAELNALIDRAASKEVEKKYAAVLPTMQIMLEIYQKLAALRKARGSMDIESGESKLIIDEDGICIDVKKVERGITEQLIEEFMLLANGCAANLARKKQLPFVYRIHEQPDPERIAKLGQSLTGVNMPYRFANEIPTQLELSELLDKTRNTPLERTVHINILRSMAKAKYSPEPKGHYGLNLDDYAHFTSPIRRYPDLAIHRILSAFVNNMPEEKIKAVYTGFATSASGQSTERELVAMTAERDCEDCYKAEYMQQFIGQELEGTISSVAAHGLYVELPNTVEGLVHITRLSQNSAPVLTEGVGLYDALSGKNYKIGDQVRVKVLAAEVSTGNIDFDLV
ncbi:MAG: RNB domain-containing ribonuclease, partial [Oscillospiraceae bacterium]|nr:RNB domain-containing ribonuclease [Oscillospiraceae bacterium]